MTATHTTVFLVFGSKSFCCRAAIHSARLCIVRDWRNVGPGVDPAPARPVQPIITYDCGILLEKSLTWNRPSKKKKKKKKKSPWPCNTSAISSYTLKQPEVRMRKFWGTEVSSHNSTHEPPLEMNGSEDSFGYFCPQWRTSNFAWKLAQGVYSGRRLNIGPTWIFFQFPKRNERLSTSLSTDFRAFSRSRESSARTPWWKLPPYCSQAIGWALPANNVATPPPPSAPSAVGRAPFARQQVHTSLAN